MKIAVFFIFTHLLGYVYGSDGLSADDYLPRLKAAIGKKDPKDLAYLDLSKVPADDTQLLPFKKEYIFLNGTSVVECTSESLLFEYLLGTRGRVERSSYKITDFPKAFAEQRISVRGIKLLMAHWLRNETHRFVSGSRCTSEILGYRERAREANVFGLYEREAFLESCRPKVGIVDILTLLLAESLVDILLRPEPQTDVAAKVPVTDPLISKKDERKAKQKERRAKQRNKYKERLRSRKVSARETAAAATTDDDQGSEGEDETVPIAAGAAAALNGEDDATVVVHSSQQDAMAILEAALLPSQGSSDGLAPRLDPTDLASELKLGGTGIYSAASKTSPRRDVHTSAPPRRYSPPSTPPKRHTPPSSPSKSPSASTSSRASVSPSKGESWSVEWESDRVRGEYMEILRKKECAVCFDRFSEFQRLASSEGMRGIMKLDLEKLSSRRATFSHRLNDYYRVVFTADSKTKRIIFIKGIEHYKGAF